MEIKKRQPKYKVGDWLMIESSGECCGVNTPSDHGYTWDGEDGKSEYPYPVEVIKITDKHPQMNNPLYRIRYKFGECNIYQDGLRLPADNEELEIIVEEIRKDINETIK